MNSIQLALIVGAFTASGLAIIVLRLIPADPDLRSFLADLSPNDQPTGIPTTGGGVTGTDRVGLWITRTLHTSWLNPPAADLAILRKPLYQFWGEKVMFGLVGLLLPLAVSALAAVVSAFTGFRIPLYLPIVATIACAVGFSFIPDYNVRSDAATARFTFRQTLAVYVDLVSMQRRTKAQPRQAMEVAADAADAWALHRIREVLLRSKVTGDFPWDALSDLGDQIAVPELVEVADIMRLAGNDDAAVFHQLRSYAASMRDALRNEDLARANAAAIRLSIPSVLLGILFILLLCVPILLRLITSL